MPVSMSSPVAWLVVAEALLWGLGGLVGTAYGLSFFIMLSPISDLTMRMIQGLRYGRE